MSSDNYEQTRRRFDELETEQQAQFLIEASASALARGIEQMGAVLADGLQDVIRRSHRPSGTPRDPGPGAAEPETAQRQAPQEGGASDT
ncbi:hypothetical protein [Salinibacter altiplanensis]|uniref:hypothetical protein n=1 Tax=Salinibacter altiplanensis TaxID=1803181 RepID=UPI000C9FC896|nr:hypothetical protein [Salinibacter altiplanensis]